MSRRAASPGGAADREDAPFEPTLPAAHARWPEETAAFARGFDRGALRVVTWNLQLLPGTFAGQGGCPASLERRAKRIVDNVLALARATRVDVVAFQEVWHEGAARALRAGLRALFPHQHRPAAYCGLLTVTRAGLPHAHARFEPFRNTAGVEGWWFTKGVAAVVVETEEATRENPYVAEPFAVLNAHAQSDFWASGAATRASQMTQTREMLNEMARERYSRLDSRDSACDMTTLLVGDLNVAAGSEEYRAAMRALGDPTDILAADARIGTDAFTFPSARTSRRRSGRSLCRWARNRSGRTFPRRRQSGWITRCGFKSAATIAAPEKKKPRRRRSCSRGSRAAKTARR